MDLGDRMKRYECVSDGKLIRRMPVIGRIDGKAFHTFTRDMEKPFDTKFQGWMLSTALALFQDIQGCKLAYVQSDEINLLLTDYEQLETEAWFDNRTNKMCSVAAGIASAAMTLVSDRMAVFDARFFNVPKEDVCNYFIWRQKDAVKNSINMYAQSMFSHDSLQGLNGAHLQELMWSEKEFNWSKAAIIDKRGACIIRLPQNLGWMSGTVCSDTEIPEFTKDRYYIEKLLLSREEREVAHV